MQYSCSGPMNKILKKYLQMISFIVMVMVFLFLCAGKSLNTEVFLQGLLLGICMSDLKYLLKYLHFHLQHRSCLVTD